MANPPPDPIERRCDVSWFVWVVVGGTLISWILDVTIGRDLPIQPLARLLLMLQIVVILAIGRHGRPLRHLPFLTSVALTAFFVGIVIPLEIAMMSGTKDALRAFVFMHSVSLFLVFFAFVPLHMTPGPVFKSVLIFALGFGAIQVLVQDLLFSDHFRTELGVLFDTFVNGRVRATGLFASKARFGEAVTLALAVVGWRLLRGEKISLQIVLGLVLLWMLYNSYSRAGYFLAGVTLLLLVLSAWKRRRNRNEELRLLFMSIIVITAVTLIGVFLSFQQENQIDIFDAQSLIARLTHWESLGLQNVSYGFVQQLFGTGQAAMFSRSEANYYVIDNLFLAVYVYGGTYGLMTFLLASFAVLRTARVWDHEGRLEPLRAFTLALFAEGLFLDNHNTLFLALFAVLAMIGPQRFQMGPETGKMGRQGRQDRISPPRK